jgi:hypothetical protein
VIIPAKLAEGWGRLNRRAREAVEMSLSSFFETEMS